MASYTPSTLSAPAKCAACPGSPLLLLRFKDFDDFEDATLDEAENRRVSGGDYQRR